MALTATRHGPLQIWTPAFATLNVEALGLAALAAALLFGFAAALPRPTRSAQEPP